MQSDNHNQTSPGHEQPSGPRRSLEEACSEVDREIKVRQRCYDRWIQDGKLSTVDARDRIERLQSALAYLERARLLEEADIAMETERQK